jgi:hypothetical protein
MSLLGISKGELWLLRRALESLEPEDLEASREVVGAILEKNVAVFITDETMYKDPADAELSEEEAAVVRQADEEDGYDEESE